MVKRHNENAGTAGEEERDLTLIAMLVGVIIVAGGVFIINSASTNYMTASYKAPPLPSVAPIMTPATIPQPNTAPTQ